MKEGCILPALLFPALGLTIAAWLMWIPHDSSRCNSDFKMVEDSNNCRSSCSL
jgi:hypothetical protein